MNIRNKKMLSFICAITILLSSVCTNIGIISSTVYADTVDNSIEQNKILGEEIIKNEQITKEDEKYESEEKTDENIEEILDIPKSDEYISNEKTEDNKEKEDKVNNTLDENDEENDIEEGTNETLDENDEIVEEIKEDNISVLYAEPGEQATVTHNGYSKWNGSSVGNFFVNGKRVFCIAHDLRSPTTGTLVTAMKTNTWDSDVWLNVIKCLYYGWGGIEQWEGFNNNEAKGIVMTSLALNNFYMGQNNKNGVAFQNYVRSKELPELKLSFSDSHLVGCISGDQQTTNQTTLLGDPNKAITFELQTSVQLHNMTQGTISSGTVTLHGGDTFWLSAPLNVETNWTSPDIYGQLDLLQALVWINGDTSVNQPVAQIDTCPDISYYINFSVEWEQDETGPDSGENPGPEQPKASVRLTKTNEDGSALVAGAIFKVWNDEGYSKNVVTNSAGEIVLDDLDIGNYYYQEISAPYGYLLNSTIHTLTFSENGENLSCAESIKNSEPTGTLSVTKEDDITGNTIRIDNLYHHGDASLNGAVYTLYANGRITNRAGTVTYFNANEPIATFTFDEKGIATVRVLKSSSSKLRANGSTLTGIPLGNYYLKETTVPMGYKQDTNTYSYDFSYVNQNTPIIYRAGTVLNDVKREPFEIIKVSTDTNDTAELIEGAEFTAILKKYVDFYGSFEEAMEHTDEYAFDEWCVMTTDKKGYAVSDRLAFGRYVVRETYVPSDTIIKVKDFEVSLTKDSETPTQSWKVENDTPFTAYLKLVKRDELSGKTVVYSNATFELYKLNEDTKEWEKVKCKVGKDYYDYWSTDENGIAYTENKLHYGNFKLIEIKTPLGFNELDHEVIFRVSASNETCEYDIDGDAWITVDVTNLQPTGKIIINKKVEEIEQDSGYTYLAEDIDYSKIRFEIKAAEDIIDYSDGSHYYKKDEVVGIYAVGYDGTLTVEDLPMGKFFVKEISTLEGYVLDEETYTVEFIQTDTTTKVYEYKLNLENLMTTIEISKVNIKDKLIEGCTLELYKECYDKNVNTHLELVDTWTTNDTTHIVKGLSVDCKYVLKEIEVADNYVLAKDINFTVENCDYQKVKMIDKQVAITKVNVEGETVEGAYLQVIDRKGRIIDEWISSKTFHYVTGLKEGEKYTLVEVYAPKGYVKAKSIEFTVTYDKLTQKIQIIDKVVSMTKTDLGGNEIEGAEMSVTDERGNIVDSWVSTKNPHYISNLVEGKKYVLHELYAPEGFTVATDMEFTVTMDKTTQEIVLIDKVVEMSKVDIGGNELEGATMIVTSVKTKNIVDKWISSKEPHRIQGLIEGESYILHEEIAIDGYVKATDINFQVSTDKNTQRIEMIDKIVLISKTDLTTGEELPGAELIVTDKDGNVIDKWISSDEPHHVSGLEEGKEYTLTEITCPYGYEQAESITFTVSYDKQTQLIQMQDMPILKTIKLVKTDSETKEIIKADFKFGIYEDPECTRLIKEVTSDKETGTATFEDLRYGEYYIKELEAPKRISIIRQNCKN